MLLYSEGDLTDVNLCIIGGGKILDSLKKSSVTDMTIYHRKTGDGIITAIVPNPEKIQTVAFALNMADFVVISVEKIDKYLGEMILIANEFSHSGKIIIYEDYMEDELKKILKGTKFEKFPILLNPTLEELIDGMAKESGDSVKVLVDQYFKVNGVGDVILGFMKSGCVKKFDKLNVYPSKDICVVKSIQIMSKNVDKCCYPSRIGFSLKTASKLERGMILSDSELPVCNELNGKIIKSKFYKFDLPKQFQAVIGLQYVTASYDGKTMKLMKDVVGETFGNPIILIDQNKFPRLIGRFDVIKSDD